MKQTTPDVLSETEESLSSCPICESASVEVLLTLRRLPVFCNVLYESESEARATVRGDIVLKWCGKCEHLFNDAFDGTLLDYDIKYDNTLHYSPKFESFATELARELIERYSLRQKSVIDVGCGKGDFLRLLCNMGSNNGTGFDPAFDPKDLLPADRFHVVREYYGPAYGDVKADLLITRHVLEHIEKPTSFMEMIRAASAKQQCPVYVEVPNTLATLRDLAIWDLIYEHYNYFTPSSLQRLFEKIGFRVTSLRERFGQQYLSIEGIVGTPVAQNGSVHLSEVEPWVETFYDRFIEKQRFWNSRMENLEDSGKRAVLWGAGSKGVTMLNLLESTKGIEAIVDVNPRKQGKYVAGTGLPIVAPEMLQKIRPSSVIVLNPLYQREISAELDMLGVRAQLLVA